MLNTQLTELRVSHWRLNRYLLSSGESCGHPKVSVVSKLFNCVSSPLSPLSCLFYQSLSPGPSVFTAPPRKKHSLDQVDTTAAEVYFGKRGKNTRSEIWVTQLEKLWLLVVVTRAGLDYLFCCDMAGKQAVEERQRGCVTYAVHLRLRPPPLSTEFPPPLGLSALGQLGWEEIVSSFWWTAARSQN